MAKQTVKLFPSIVFRVQKFINLKILTSQIFFYDRENFHTLISENGRTGKTGLRTV